MHLNKVNVGEGSDGLGGAIDLVEITGLRLHGLTLQGLLLD